MYFGSVKFFKHVIVLITLLLIIIPTVICFVLGAKSNGLSEENEKLRSEINEYSSRAIRKSMKTRSFLSCTGKA